MKQLRKQIKESFFNPIFHFFPLMLFLGLNCFYGMNTAWKIAFPIALIFVVYIYYAYKRIFIWHLISTFLFVGVSLVASFAILLPTSSLIHHFIFELVVLPFMLVFLIFRKQILRKVIKISSMRNMSKLISMSNNFEELYRVIWAMVFILVTYISANILLLYADFAQPDSYHILLQGIYSGGFIVLIVYEIIRVQIIRGKLVREEWWPIVSDQGKIIGSIQHSNSLVDDHKYMHPIVRVLLVENGMVYLQKKPEDDLIFPGKWDTAISNHVRMEETVEQCIDRTADEKYALNDFKYTYLSNYYHETDTEKHYAFLFVSVMQKAIKLIPTLNEQTKWWTQQQIDDNLESGIFSENLKIEIDFLKRSGLLETERCSCECNMRDVIYDQANVSKKE